MCQRCIKSGLDCSYGLQLIWHEESLSKGVCHGRAGVWSKSGRRKDDTQLRCRGLGRREESATTRPSSSRGVFLNTTMNDVRLYFEYAGMAEEDDTNNTQDILPNENRQLSLSLPVLSTTTLGHLRTFDYDSALLSYYEAVVCSSSTLLDDAKNNPYRHLILPMAMQSEGLYHATLAVSAQILRIAEPRFRFAALDHGHRALRCLISSLQRGQSSPQHTSQKQMSHIEIDEILGLALMLCWFEITDGCRPSWVTHLKGIYTLINQYQDVFIKSSRTSDVSRFFSRYFSFHLVLARTAFRVEDDITFTKTASSESASTQDYPSISKLTDFLSLAMPLEDLDQIDSYMGFSNSLLLLINEVADLAWKYHSKESVEADLSFVREQVRRLRTSLETLQQTPPPLADNGRVDDIHFYALATEEDGLLERTVAEFQAIAEANRIGALLLLYEVCASRFQRPDLFKTAAVTEIESDETSGYDSASTDYKTRYVRGILDPMIQNINRISRTAALPLWPLFIAGCCVTAEEDQITVIKIFEETEKLKRYGVCLSLLPFFRVKELISVYRTSHQLDKSSK